MMFTGLVLFSWVHILMAFVGGVIAGLTVSRLKYFSKPPAVPVKQIRSIEKADAVEMLEKEGKIKMHLSPADNAVFILEAALPLDMCDTVRASVVYALDVLKSDSTHATVPVGLRIDKSEHGGSRKFSTVTDEGDSAVLDWLLSNYTPQPQAPTRSKLTFKQVAQGVKFAIKLQNVFGAARSSREFFIYDVEDKEFEQINQSLETVDEWDWDIWKFKEVTRGRPLQTLGWHLLHKWDLVRILKLDRSVLRNWLVYVEKLYVDNEYHNSTHAADVLQAVHHLLLKGGASDYLSTVHVFALLVTAMIHDAGHDGFNNLYHQNAITERALTFNDQSIQENFHCMTIFSNMSKDPRINILSALKADQAREVRRLMILMTLATDMKNHFKHFQEFKSLISSRGSSREQWSSDSIASDQLCANILHAADLSNPCRNFDLAHRWACQVLQEFFVQGDTEKTQGLPISPLCSRDTTLMPASQIGFINFIVLPYFQVLGELLPNLRSGILRQVESNLQRWRQLEAEDRTAAGAAVIDIRQPDTSGSGPSTGNAGGGGSIGGGGGGGGGGVRSRRGSGGV